MRKTILCFAGMLTVMSSQADESLWIYAKGADTMPKGALEYKLNIISRRGKDSGDYVFNDIRPEVEYGLTNKLTVYGELMVFDHDYAVENPELNPMFETQGGEGGSFDRTQVGGFELGLKYNVLSVYKDPVGLSFGFAYENRNKYRLDGSDINQDSFVFTTYLQKNFLDNTLQLVANLKMEFERRNSPGVLEEEIAFDGALGIAYRFKPKWSVGMEFRHQSDYLNPQEDGVFNPELDRSSFDLTDFRIGSQHQRGNYVGPSLHYAQKEWWVTGGILWQVAGGGSPFSLSYGDRNWDEHERVHAGLTIGFEFD
jgi:hypothetical protein